MCVVTKSKDCQSKLHQVIVLQSSASVEKVCIDQAYSSSGRQHVGLLGQAFDKQGARALMYACESIETAILRVRRLLLWRACQSACTHAQTCELRLLIKYLMFIAPQIMFSTTIKNTTDHEKRIGYAPVHNVPNKKIQTLSRHCFFWILIHCRPNLTVAEFALSTTQPTRIYSVHFFTAYTDI